ncbi:DUF397 domain-containing protein [Streptomyces sp. NPDC005859]|uniref:DUF397 domain-containing protein n=1 Tax=Streptomyces sp. NPDC005859 TaxID=3157170 RepID=UPI00340B349A
MDDCVETATTPVALHVRDSKNAEGRRPTLSRAAWVRFVSALSTPRFGPLQVTPRPAAPLSPRSNRRSSPGR